MDAGAAGVDTGGGGQSVDEPVWVNAAYLTMSCVTASVDQNVGNYVVQCDLLGKDGAKVRPETVADKWSWAFDAGGKAVDVEVVPSQDPAAPMVTYNFGKTGYVPISTLTAVDLQFKFEDPATSGAGVISARMAAILAGLANQTDFRLVIGSIRAHDPAQPVQLLTKIEFKVDGVWMELAFDEPKGRMVLAGNPATSNGDGNDLAMFRNMFGYNTPLLTVAAFNRFDQQAPHDAAPEPLWIAFHSDVPRSVTGLRYNGGERFANRNLATGFPDMVHFETKRADGAWKMVEGSLINVATEVDNQILEYFWNGSDF